MQIFDASGIEPRQGSPAHPPGMFDFQITNTFGKPTKDNTGGMFVVEFSSPAGKIENRYNIWNQSTQAVEIAQKELSALCHAVGIFKLSFDQNDLANCGKELRGARGRMEIGPQKNNAEYMEVKRVFDAQGNEPGKAPASAPSAASGGWGAPAPQQQQQQPQQPQQQPQPAQGGWGSGQQPIQQQPQQQPQQQQPPNGAPAAPPWAR